MSECWLILFFIPNYAQHMDGAEPAMIRLQHLSALKPPFRLWPPTLPFLA
jgi:hypothetical protein